MGAGAGVELDAVMVLGLVDELVLLEVLALDDEPEGRFDEDDAVAALGGPLLWNSAYLFFSLSRGRAAFLIPLRYILSASFRLLERHQVAIA